MDKNNHRIRKFAK